MSTRDIFAASAAWNVSLRGSNTADESISVNITSCCSSKPLEAACNNSSLGPAHVVVLKEGMYVNSILSLKLVVFAAVAKAALGCQPI